MAADSSLRVRTSRHGRASLPDDDDGPMDGTEAIRLKGRVRGSNVREIQN